MTSKQFNAIMKEIAKRKDDAQAIASIIHTYFEPSPYRRETPRFLQFMVGLHLDLQPLYNPKLGRRVNKALKLLGYATVRANNINTVRGIEVRPQYYAFKGLLEAMMRDFDRVDKGPEYWTRYKSFKSILESNGSLSYEELNR